MILGLMVGRGSLYKPSDNHERCVDRVGEGARTIAELLRDLDGKGEFFRVYGSRKVSFKHRIVFDGEKHLSWFCGRLENRSIWI